MKTLVIVFACLVGVSASAQQSQNSEIRDLSQQVYALVHNNIQALPPQSRQYVRDSLKGVVQAFAMAGVNVNVGNGQNHHAPPPPPPPVQPKRNLVCDSNDNTLHDISANGGLIYDFNNISDCNQAKEYVSINQPFCDTNDNTLHRPNGKLIHDFNNSDDCRNARNSAASNKGFCDFNDNTLYNADGKLLYDFNNSTDCINAQKQL